MIGVLLAAAAMMTTWGEKVTSENAWRDYPRPQMVRENWTCLNGDWDYQVTSVTNTPGRPAQWAGKIRVPFAIESKLSQVGRLLEPNEFLWYTRTINCNPEPGKRILLHFGGVDFRTMVFIGHNEVTDVPHEGGQNHFTIDITDYVKPGVNELTLCVWDPTNDFVNSRGKQDLEPNFCFYTRVSGIWQTVWMEEVPEAYVESYRVTTDIDKGEVAFTFKTVGERSGELAEVEVFDVQGKTVVCGKAVATGPLTLKMPNDFKLWSPESPYLYTFKAKFAKDVFRGYFGMRKFAKGRDKNGYLRFFLNNKPYYLMGTLDQGWWPDGLLTPPSEEAMAHDIKALKDCGYNMMRKHIKVEPLRYYALCDKMGILVVQDLPSGSGSWFGPMFDYTVQRYALQRREMKEIMDNLYNVPSIVMWCPYNEGWSQPGEFLTHSMLDFVRRHDPTRLVNGPSGHWDWEGGDIFTKFRDDKSRTRTRHKPAGECEAGDTIDMHVYRGPDMFPANDRRISFLGEFGGLGHPVAGHLWKVVDGNWGYGGIEDTKTREGLEKTYLGLMKQLEGLAEKGLAGSVYTQTTDVETEINGLMTYDRKVLKFDPAVLKKAHDAVRNRVEHGVKCKAAMPAIEEKVSDTDAAVIEVLSPDELRRAIAMHGAKGAVIELVGDEWRFSKDDQTLLSFFISNNHQSPVHNVHLPIVGCTNLVLRGRGQTLVFDNPSIGVYFKDSRNVTFENMKFDWNKPWMVESTIVGFDKDATIVDVKGEMIPTYHALLLDGKTHKFVPHSNDILIDQPIAMGKNRYRVARDLRKCGDGAKVGDLLSFRPKKHYYPAMVLDHVKGTKFVDVAIHTAGAMGLIAQMCEDFTWIGTKDALAKTSGVFPPEGSGRVMTLHADATHFSNCKGTVTIKNCAFETMMDDALNVHNTCLAIREILSANRIRVKFMHNDAHGFEVFHPGDVVRFIHARTLENGEERVVEAVERLSDFELILKLKGSVPTEITVGDAVENATYQPAVVFEKNVVARNRARGILITTPKPVSIKDNLFDAVSGAAILFAGDSSGWYESGACRDVLVTNNVFRECMSCEFQFCNAVITSYPIVKDVKNQKMPYHRNVRIVGNTFERNYGPHLFKLSADIVWKNNKEFDKSFPYGVCAHVTRSEREQTRLNKTMNAMELAGMRYVRSDFDAAKVVRKEGGYDFSDYDGLVAEIEARGMKLVPIIYGLRDGCPPDDFDAYREYIKAIIVHFGARHFPVVEIWNEANLDMFFKGADPAMYAKTLKTAYEAVKSVDPQVRVMFTGTAGVPIDWMRKVFEAGAANSFDVMAVHPYAHPGQPEGSVDTRTDELRNLLKEYGREDVPVWFTEMGWPTHSVSDKIDHAHVLTAGLKVARPEQKAWNVVVADLQPDGPEPDQTMAEALLDILPTGSTVKVCTQKETVARLTAGGVDAVVYPFDESYPSETEGAVLKFMSEGGVLVDFGGAPCYYARRGGELVKKGEIGNFPFGIRAFWMGEEGRYPKGAQVFATKAGLAAGVKQEPTGFKADAIYLAPDRAGEGSEWIALIAGKNAKGEELTAAAVIRYKGKCKGAAVLCSLPTKGAAVTVDEEMQACYTARVLGISFAKGIEAYFQYNLRAQEKDPFYSEDHFGLMHANFQPKPAYSAYANFTRERPAGSVQKPGAWHDEKCKLYYPQWTKPDGTKAGMLWTTGEDIERAIRFIGGTPVFRNMYGRKIAVCEVGKGVYKLKLTGSPIYFSGAEKEIPDRSRPEACR